MPQVFFGLQAIVKNDNRTLLRVFQRLSQAFFGSKLPVEIPGQYVPHHDAVTFTNLIRLFRRYSSIRWPKKQAFVLKVHDLAALLYVRQVLLGWRLPSVQVVESMITHCVAVFYYLAVNFGMP